MFMLSLPLLLNAAASVTCRAVDGDTLRCGQERVRLIGIDAPELPGHCRRGRRCAPGSGALSKANLATIVDRRPVRLIKLGRDHYGRTLAVAYVGQINLACSQLRARQAIYKGAWDNAGRVAQECRFIR